MSDVKVILLVDRHECDYCGSDYVEGGVIEIDGKTVFEMQPISHCYGGNGEHEICEWQMFEKTAQRLKVKLEGDDKYDAKKVQTLIREAGHKLTVIDTEGNIDDNRLNTSGNSTGSQPVS